MDLSQLSQLSENQFADLFNTGNETLLGPTVPKFGGGLEQQGDIFTTPTSSTTTTTTVIQDDSTTTTTTQLEEADILAQQKLEEEKNKGKDSVVADMSSYFQDRFKTGKLIPIETENEKGEAVPFIPQTPEEIDEVIELQVNHKLDLAKKELDQNWYASKAPAWQFVADYAEKLNSPAELLPLLQGINNIESIAKLNVKEIDDAERLLRISFERSGQPLELIDTQIESLKATNKILETAEKLQPVMIQQEQRNLQASRQQQLIDEQKRENMILEIRDRAVKAIESPLGKESLKREEKLAVFELIGVPDEQSQGYKIFDKIDELFEKGDFDKLRKIALLINNEEAYNKYISSGPVQEAAASLQKKIRLAGEKNTGNSKDQDASGLNKAPIQRNNEFRMPRFGRG
jgi:hypothetical protein